MDVFSCLTLCGGLSFFLAGMGALSRQLRVLSGGRLERWLQALTDAPLTGLALGAGLTAALQSSSAVTVLLAGLADAGVIRPRQAAPVIMGCNIGTTLTVWLLALSGLPEGGFWPLRPESFAPILALAGVLLRMSTREPRRRAVGGLLTGFALLLCGMELMQRAAAPLAGQPKFQALLTAFHHPLAGLLAGTVFTGVIQSSAASLAILQALSRSGQWTVRMALPVILGQNIGTCVTALLSAIGAGRGAGQVAAFHICFNLTGAAVWLSLFGICDALMHPALADAPIHAVGIALCHTAFNLSTAALLLPLVCRPRRSLQPFRKRRETVRG